MSRYCDRQFLPLTWLHEFHILNSSQILPEAENVSVFANHWISFLRLDLPEPNDKGICENNLKLDGKHDTTNRVNSAHEK